VRHVLGDFADLPIHVGIFNDLADGAHDRDQRAPAVRMPGRRAGKVFLGVGAGERLPVQIPGEAGAGHTNRTRAVIEGHLRLDAFDDILVGLIDLHARVGQDRLGSGPHDRFRPTPL
jgi:hypothetical protein